MSTHYYLHIREQVQAVHLGNTYAAGRGALGWATNSSPVDKKTWNPLYVNTAGLLTYLESLEDPHDRAAALSGVSADYWVVSEYGEILNSAQMIALVKGCAEEYTIARGS